MIERAHRMATPLALWSLLAASASLAGCMDRGSSLTGSFGVGGSGGAGGGESTSTTVGSGGGDIPFNPGDPPPCNPSVSIESTSRALLVRDPALLAPFTLERVLQQLLERGGDGSLTPLALLQRLFDTENSSASAVFADVIHCDTVGNAAFKNAPPQGCPRAEGALAKSEGLLTPGHPDYFAPVALVNRFDLTPQTLTSCGEYRLVFAKWSGRGDPNDRVFLIFEGALPNPTPGDVWGCRPVALHWASLAAESDPSAVTKQLEAFYFTGITPFTALVDPKNFGLLSGENDPYGSSHGQVRLSQRMQDPWEMRELRFLPPTPESGNAGSRFVPSTVKNNPLASLFASANEGAALSFQSSFVSAAVPTLAASSLGGIRMATDNQFNGGESALEGGAGPDYLAAVGDLGEAFPQSIEQRLASVATAAACDASDPLTAQSILGRAVTQTCAGCHAPQAFLGPERKIGCGLVWPDSLGGAHIDEQGALSPALSEVFLPQRASVLSTYLQACDVAAIFENLQPVPFSEGGPE